MKKSSSNKKVFIIVPLYNDWKSLSKLLNKLENIKKTIKNLSVLVVNDYSSQKQLSLKIKKKNFIKKVEVLNLRKNFGHDRAIIFGFYFLIFKKKSFDSVITMDSDGEDNPKYINRLLTINKKSPDKIIICRRKKRSENLLFKFLYNSHLMILFFFTFKWINHGGFNLIPKNHLISLLKSSTIWGNYSASLEKLECKKIYINSNRSKRFYGPSKTSFAKLFLHSFSIMSVFKKHIFVLGLFYLFILKTFLLNNMLIYFIFFIFFIFLLILSFREKKNWKKIIFKNISSLKRIA